MWRQFRKTNYSDKTVKIILGKNKKQRLVGIPGEVEFQYEKTENRYHSANENPKITKINYYESESKEIRSADEINF